MIQETTITGWHFIQHDRTMRYTGAPVVAGETARVDGPLELCVRGLHGSLRALDALTYAPSAVVSWCDFGPGAGVVFGPDKLCSGQRTALWIADATTTLHEFAVWVARQALEGERAAGREPHAASWRLLEVKMLWLAGKATTEELAAACSAAWSAAGSAAWSAAESAAEAAARCVFNAELERRLLALAPATGGE